MPMGIEEKASKVLDILSQTFSARKPTDLLALRFNTPLELLIATILSAQCTDLRVNIVTEGLFNKYKSLADYAGAPLDELASDISSINFFNNKARSIQGAATKIIKDYGGELPKELDGLTSLPGVGRKTANVVLGNAFGIPALAVDTHVKRVSARLGLTTNTDPDKVEADLTAIIPDKRWTMTTHLLIQLGRKLCKARKPLCAECPVSEYCDYYIE